MSPLLRRILWIAGGVAGLLVLVVLLAVVYINLSWDKQHERPVPVMQASNDPAAVARGEYLYKVTLQCWACHSETFDSKASPSGGRAFDLRNVGPGFGIFYSKNITPDKETGIGAWTDGEIVRSLREGLSRDGRLLFPIMPVEAFRGLSDDDALAIVSYLRTLEPVNRKQPDADRSFMAKALYAFGAIKPEVAITEPIIAPQKSISAEYGRYMANNGAICMDCHTPRNLQDGSFYRDSIFAGSTIAFGQDEPGIDVTAYARNITPDAETGIGNWTEEQFTDAVRAGMRPDGTALSTHMPYSYYGLMDENDIKAIFTYLKSIKPIRRTTTPPTFLPTYTEGSGVARGSVIFRNTCMPCHGKDGKGATPTNAVLADIAPSLDDQMLADFISGGNVGLRMPAFGKTLSAEQIRDVVAYIRTVQTSPK